MLRDNGVATVCINNRGCLAASWLGGSLSFSDWMDVVAFSSITGEEGDIYKWGTGEWILNRNELVCHSVMHCVHQRQVATQKL